ncbi:MAG: glycosyltransferase family 2 protein [Vicinamibacterales bacterium]
MRCPSLTELPPPPESTTIWPWTRASRALPDTMDDGRPWPLISIVTPAYNQGEYLEQAIRSVLLQGYPRIELIVMDGGSTDSTLEVLERYEPWLKHWVSKRDTGPASALNEGFGFASGEIYGFLNADDFLLEGCLARVAKEFAAHPEADVVSGHGYFAKPDGALGMPTYSDSWSLARFRYGACILLQPATFFTGAMFTKVHGFRERSSTVWDMELWADMAEAERLFVARQPAHAHIARRRLLRAERHLTERQHAVAQHATHVVPAQPQRGPQAVRHVEPRRALLEHARQDAQPSRLLRLLGNDAVDGGLLACAQRGDGRRRVVHAGDTLAQFAEGVLRIRRKRTHGPS